ncbi:hypothetical protein EIP91_007273 [Steccherinum ochraceum]|uniref:NADP-dependent oxidoreductase domain-containing protein n=1 Tax=Steccherinum ochraceum TaxID=92696 RepID=A0A4V2MVF4_9APHY|nr:hypothetical protein EIP91_007273 [Steccherinum ochraceum]
MSTPIIKLNNGVEMPAIGLGTWQSKPEEVISAVEYAIKEAGYRHIDCAWNYHNEKEVGEGIRRSGVPRKEIFLTTKCWPSHYDDVAKSLDLSLANFGVDYVDLYLLHWPVCLNPKGNHPIFPTRPDGSRDVLLDWPLKDTWKQMEDLLKTGKVKAIGVSNASELKLNEILPYATVVPAVNQLELHLYNHQPELVEFCQSKGITVQAYSPLGSVDSPLFKDEVANAIAKKYDLQVSDVLVGYLVAKNIVALPKSVTHYRILSNIKGTLAAVAKLTKEDVEQLDAVEGTGKHVRVVRPPWGTLFRNASAESVVALLLITPGDDDDELPRVCSAMSSMIFQRHPRYALLVFVILAGTVWLLFSDGGHVSQAGVRDLSLSARLDRAEKIYQKTLKGRQGLIKKFGPTPNQIAISCMVPYDRFPPDENPWPPYTAWDFFPPAFNCPHERERIGTLGDGGKWMCGLSRVAEKRDCIVYSFGINGESSFEAEILSRTSNCQIWGYDFSVNSFGPEIPATEKHRTHFHAYGLAGHDAHGPTNDIKYYTLQSLMDLNGHDHIDILKIDVESWEFEVVTAFLEPYLRSGKPLPFGQLQIELHTWEKKFPEVLEWWEKLEQAGLRPFFQEPNLVYNNYNRGRDQDLTEYSLINIRGNNAFISDATL